MTEHARARWADWLLPLAAVLGTLAPAAFARPQDAEVESGGEIAAAEDAAGEDAREEDAALPPIGRVVKLTSPIDDRVTSAVRTAAVELSARSQREDREAVLILELPAGTSEYHHVLKLTGDLTSAEFASLKTVCWVPESVDGYNAMVAIACDDVVMHPDAEVGDFGRGEALPEEQVMFVRRLVDGRGNGRVNAALAVAMADPAATLLAVDVQPRPGVTERRLMLESGVESLRKTGVLIRDTRVVKEPGVPLLLSANRAEKLDVLISSVADGLDQVVERYDLPREAMRSAGPSGDDLVVRKIEVRDVIDPLLYSFVSNQINEAVSEGANLIIFEITSPGGYLIPSQELANQIADLSDRDIRTVAWVPNEAISGAAIIALGTDEIILAPDATIGDAGPIMMREGGAFEHTDQKVVSKLSEDMANLAERKGRAPALARAMVDRKLDVFEVRHSKTGRVSYMTDDEIARADGVWVRGRKIKAREDDKFFTVDGDRAAEVGLASPPAEDFEELRLRLNIPPETKIRVVERTWVDDMVFLMNTPVVSTLLIFVGILCVYLELHLMTGLFAIGAMTSFSLFFWSHYLGGTAGMLEIVLFVLGLTFLAIEIFVIPGFGVFGVSGILMLIASLVLASMTFRGFSSEESLADTGMALGQLAVAFAGVLVVGSLMGKYLPKIPLFSSMVLAPPGAGEGDDGVRLRPELDGAAEANSLMGLVGDSGTAATTLRPAGKAQVGDRYVDVVSDGPFIEQGTPIEVVQVEGNRVVVRAKA